jgi:hypothetical protein
MDEPIYSEKLQSNLTSGLFGVLALVFLTLFGWRFSITGWTVFVSGFIFPVLCLQLPYFADPDH